MHKIERRRWEWIGQQIVPPHLDPLVCRLFQQRRVEVDRDDRATAPDAVGKDLRDRTAARPHIKTPPPLTNRDRIELRDRQRVVRLF